MARLDSPGALEAALRREPPPAILDVRGVDAFAAAHVAKSGHVPADELPWRLHELPFRRDEPLVVLGDDRSLDAAAALLAEEGFTGLLAAPFDDARAASLPIERGERAERLWSPTRWVEESLPFLESARGLGPVLDLACGNGRNAVFLALRGFDAIGCDVLESALDRTRALARSSGVRVGTWLVDLERDERPLAQGAFGAIVVLNYLHRPLAGSIRDAVVPGGVVVYETFTTEQRRLFGKPRRPRFLLEPGELPRLFFGFEILAAREAVEPGRAVASLVARRPRRDRV